MKPDNERIEYHISVQPSSLAGDSRSRFSLAPGQFQFNVVIPTSLANGVQPITATYANSATQAGALIAIHN